MKEGRIDAHLVCGGTFHDFDFARLELLKLLAEHDRVRTITAEDYRRQDAIAASRFLVTYTCDVCPSEEEQEALRRFVESGGHWFALHATSALLGFVPVEGGIEVDGIELPGKADTPDRAPRLMELLGNRFVAHPSVQKIHVAVTNPDHPLVRGIEAFDVVDEPYYCEFHKDAEVLLESRYTSPATGYVRSEWPEDVARPQLTLRPFGKGAVLYLTLGHCRGRYDLQPLMDECSIQRCAWDEPVYYELLRRGIRWAMQSE